MNHPADNFRSIPARRGFTMIELVLVLAILAICAMVAAPSLGGFARGRALPNTATEFVTTARWCRVQALSDGLVYRMNIDGPGGRWWVTKDDGSGTNFAEVTVDNGREFKLPEKVTMETSVLAVNGEVYISFTSGGRTDVGKMTFAYDGAQIDVGCESPLGVWHVIPKSGTP